MSKKQPVNHPWKSERRRGSPPSWVDPDWEDVGVEDLGDYVEGERRRSNAPTFPKRRPA